MNVPGNTLVVHVHSVRGLHVKGGKTFDVYCSLSTMGKGAWKSKVSTNALRLDPSIPEAELRWDEHCEFQLNETDTRLVIHVNHKTAFGTTETLGEYLFQLEKMPRMQLLAWFKLSKAGSALNSLNSTSNKDRGQIQLGFQFSNSIGNNRKATSVSNMSLNKIDKEGKINRLRRKMQQLGRKATGMDDAISNHGDDSQSFASVSINNRLDHNHYGSDDHRRSSLLSTNSGAHLAFSSPSPNPSSQLLPDDLTSGIGRTLAEDAISTQSTTFVVPTHHPFNNNQNSTSLSVQNIQISGSNRNMSDGKNNRNAFISTSSELTSFDKQNLNIPFNAPSQSFDFEQNSIDGNRSSISGGSAFGGIVVTPTLIREDTLLDEQKNASSQKLRVRMRQKAEQLLQLRGLAGNNFSKKHNSTQEPSEFSDFAADKRSRRDSLGSSSGFVSLGSGQLSALNEHTSPDYLLNVIKHLHNELMKKEERIRNLEEYTDKLVAKVMVTNPELLATPITNSTKVLTTKKKRL